MSGIETIETTDPEDAFAALADETRIAILRALWEADADDLSFSELREAVGVRDSGQFNYHLDRLVGRFVAETGDGYELTLAGRQVNGAVHGGAYTMEGSFEPLALSEPCPSCGGERTLSYENETVRIECDSCWVEARTGVPPGVFASYDREEVPAVTDRYFRTIYRTLGCGFCWYCGGRVDPSVAPARALMGDLDDLDEGEDYPEEYGEVPLVSYPCRRCGADPVGDLGTAVVDHPAVVGFFHDRGIDVREVPVWTFVAWNSDRASIRERDPLRAAITYSADGDDLTLVVDGDCEVVDVEQPA